MRHIAYSKIERWSWLSTIGVIISIGSLLIGGITAVRLLYETLFPTALWLGNPAVAVLLATTGTLISALVIFRQFRLQNGVALTPLALNIAYFFNSTVNLTAGWFLFLASTWLALLLWAHIQETLNKRRWLPFAFIISFLLPVYLATLGQTVGTADTFEFQVVIPRLGIVHPTGYPLYLMLTKLFTFIPINTVAWRINLGTAVYGIAATCLLYQFLKSFTGQRLVPILAAVLFGLTPTFWSQSIQAEVYALHALIVAAVLVSFRQMAGWHIGDVMTRPSLQNEIDRVFGVNRNQLRLAALLGLGLTNHLTTIILLPAILLTQVAEAILMKKGRRPFSLRSWLVILAAFLIPLLLYLYLPLRWQTVNGEPMGLGRFVDWVVGGRFQGALQLTALFNDSARIGVVGRLFTAEWHWMHLLIGLIGLIVLAKRCWPAALFLGLTLAGFTYYALSYYVPDLSVFLIPAHLVIAALWGISIARLVRVLSHYNPIGRLLTYPLLSLLMFLVFFQASDTWQVVDASNNDGQTSWGRAVLEQNLDPQGAILADSLKFPPLYYLQQAEGSQPEMDIMVLPDEAAYRAELDGRLAAGQTVYLARFLPGLAGVYHLRSLGPLTEVSPQPQTTLPQDAIVTPSSLSFPSIELIGYQLRTESPYEVGQTAVTLYWQSTGAVEETWQVYIRWSGQNFSGPILSQYPANNNYPTNAWRPGEIVADFHTLPRPILNQPTELALQVALAPPFTPSEELNWQSVTTAVIEPETELLDAAELRQQVGSLLLEQASFPNQIRPESDLLVQLQGVGSSPELLSLQLIPANIYTPAPSDQENSRSPQQKSFTWSSSVLSDVEPGTYLLVASYPGQSAVCSWLAKETTGCVLDQIEVSGAPLPDGAINFEDKIALLSFDVPDTTLHPGGQLAVNLTWQGLGSMTEDYTVFLQVLDEQDRIVGQVDSWPLQGTFPTSQWSPGEQVEDPYQIRLAEELPPGQYQLHIGWYLLGTVRRLPVLDELGTAVDDKFVVSLNVPYP